nr:hypothetical protein [Tanacetum cinerariifolium]
MAILSSSSENKSCYSKACKKNTDSLNSKITDLSEKLEDSKNMPSPSVESNPNDLQNNSSSVFEIRESTSSILSKPEIKFVKPADSPTVGKTNKDETARKPTIKYAEMYRKTSKMSNVRGNLRNWNNQKSQQLESNPNDLQNNSSSVFEIRESTSSILSKPEIKFVKPADSPTVGKTNKDETARKPTIKYAEMYRKTSKMSNVRGNLRNWNNQKSQQLGGNFVMKNKACFNRGHFDHLSYDYDLWVKRGDHVQRIIILIKVCHPYLLFTELTDHL